MVKIAANSTAPLHTGQAEGEGRGWINEGMDEGVMG